MRTLLKNTTLHKLLISFILIFTVIIFLPTSSIANLPAKTINLPLPPLAKDEADKTAQTFQDPTENWQQHKIKIRPNDSLSTALEKINIGATTVYKIARTKNSKLITDLKVGDELTVWIDSDQQLQKILYPKTQTVSYELVKTENGYFIDEKVSDVEIRTETAYGKIEGAFYLAAERAGLSAKSIMQLADMFAWDIDFIREFYKGDTFKVIYETRYLNGEYIGDGDILAAQITTNGGRETHNGFILRDKDKVIGFYDDNGKNLKKAFLRNPVDYVRITSKFNPKRFHPVLKKWRSHRGVDYGGPKGTPIRATGSGKIITRGWGNGYGNHVKIQHAGKYMTVYGHLSKFGKFKRGQYVKQGDVIGYMGMTGLATGVHLHYEFRINGKHVDPLKMKFPAANPVAAKYKQRFKQNSRFLLSQLDRIDGQTYIAKGFE
ncbi:M23 family metallopeptidase [Thiomicrorhabdus sediminis]|uniref:Peptidase M23 n=1 Tax=Thiomicrorhabdus sediminis TaxID=2580412 RepID=A0A4P9K3N7_9GAMM|nr:peptidoglycan DD-metalloendopeptidase family protein [Thiomicrorhabdus sediminis]QCU89475.1 peptidase M23 [Thiomicrorhabdus sediminis]